MKIFICLILIILCLTVFYIERKNNITPAKLFILLWTFIMLLSSLNLTGLKKASTESYVMLLTMIISYLLGYLLIKYLIKIKKDTSKQKKETKNIHYIIFFILAIILITINLIDCYIVIKYYLSGVPMWQIRNWSLEPYGSDNPIIGRIGLFEKVLRSVIIEPFNTIMPAIVSYNFFDNNGKYKKSMTTISIIALLTSSISGGGGRISFIIYIGCFVLGYILCGKKEKKKDFKKKILIASLVAIALIVTLTIVRSGVNSVLRQCYRYFAMPPTLLTIHLNDIKDISNTYGLLSFFGIHSYFFRALKMLNLNFLVPQAYENAYQHLLTAEVFKDIGNGVGNAFVTPVYYFYIDGGYIGIIFLSIIFGIITSMFYYKRIYQKKIDARNFCYYSLILYAIFISFMRIQTAIPGFIISFLLIKVLTSKKNE